MLINDLYFILPNFLYALSHLLFFSNKVPIFTIRYDSDTKQTTLLLNVCIQSYKGINKCFSYIVTITIYR